MVPRKRLIFFSLLSFSVMADETVIYKVEKNNSLSEILFSLDVKPIYGKKGYLKQVIELNSKRVKKGGNFILVGEEIYLPAKMMKREIASSPVILPEKISTEEIQQDINTFSQHSYFTLSPQLSRVAIHSRNKVNLRGTDTSNIAPAVYGVRGAWTIAVTPKSELSIFSSIGFLDFSTDSVFTISNTKFRRVSFGVNGEYEINENSGISGTIQANQNYFIDVVSPYNIQMRSLSQVELIGDYNRNLFTVDRVNSHLSLGALIILPSQGTYKSDLGYGYNLALKTKFLSKGFKFSYTQKFFKIKDVSNQSKEILAQFNLSLGDNK